MKVLALYLPQYHEIPENNKWWGHGYTEWDAVKNAPSLYDGHYQPKVPMNGNYYDLSDKNASTWRWQAKLANDYGVYGFCIYHYWFYTGEQLLEKPMEILLKHPEINIRYCVCWANETWRRTWYSTQKEILKEQRYGDTEEWNNHYTYLRQFFFDDRYIKIDKKPIVCIYRTNNIEYLDSMIELWNERAVADGFDGVYIISCNYDGTCDERASIDAYYNYEPWTYIYKHKWKYQIAKQKCKGKIARLYNRFNKNKIPIFKIPLRDLYDNDNVITYRNKKIYLGATPAFDDTPRRPHKATIIYSKSKDFYNQLKKIDDCLKKNNRDNDFVFINAWNEWGEGAYLEPDEKNTYEYLNAIKNIVY